MPRIPPSLVRQAVRRLGSEAALLLPACRDLASTRAELRWLAEFVWEQTREQGRQQTKEHFRAHLRSLCRRRGRGEPLQYILGTQPFGPLDLLCRRGVLIPRPEPEAYSMYLSDLLLRESRESKRPLSIVDVCTGSGCIALLLSARLRAAGRPARVLGVDVAREAIKLARANAARNGLASADLAFLRADAFADDWLAHVPRPLDVLVANPPYVSAAGFAHDAARSVRLFEPKLAQVPLGEDGSIDTDTDNADRPPHDRFYGRLLALAARLDARLVLCEVGSLAQAQRVVARALGPPLQEAGPVLEAEIWRDAPDMEDSEPDAVQSVVVAGHTVRVRGSGLARSVFLRRQGPSSRGSEVVDSSSKITLSEKGE